MPRARLAVIACAIAWSGVACGRFGFDGGGGGGAGDGGPRDGAGSSDAGDPLNAHLGVASGWTIAQFADLSGVVPFDGSDFPDGSNFDDNQPVRPAALYPPFTGSYAVIAGRSIIEVAADGGTTVHDFRPATPNTTGPDSPSQIAFADLGGSASGLWLTSASAGGGDGLYLIASDWTITRDTNDTTFRNFDAIGLDLTGSYDGRGGPTMYLAEENGLQLLRRTGVGTQVAVTAIPSYVEDIVTVGNQLLFTADAGGSADDDDSVIAIDRLGPGSSYVESSLASTPGIHLAEGATAGGVYGVLEYAKLVQVSANDGTQTPVAWSTDPAWQFIEASVPRAGHALAGKIIVLESNRTLNRDRLLVVTPL